MGTKGGEGCTSHSSPDTTTSLEADGDTDSSSRLHIPPSNAIQGEESLKGNSGSGGNTTRHMIYWRTINKESIDGAEVPEECTRRTTTPPDKTSAGLALERLGGCRAKRAKKDDASKKVRDAQGRHRRQRRQVDGRGFRLRLPQPPTTD